MTDDRRGHAGRTPRRGGPRSAPPRGPRTGSDAGEPGAPRASGPPARPPARPLPRIPEVEPLAAPASFLEAAAELGIAFEPGEPERLGLYLAMLLSANTEMNLTAVTEPGGAWTRHILDSLTLLAPLSDATEGQSVIDVGSGGGLPGLPLAVCAPHLKFTLLEATAKKAEFLRQAAARLGLSNVSVVAARAESAAHDRGQRLSQGRVGGHREMYHFAVARAVGRLATLAELVVPFVAVGGRALLIKGQRAEEELTEAEPALKLLNAVHAGTIQTPTGRIVVLDKRVATPRLYPRRDGEPKRSPLGVAREDRGPGRPGPASEE